LFFLALTIYIIYLEKILDVVKKLCDTFLEFVKKQDDKNGEGS